jgi:two-component system chemotaxis response regulator CheB
MIKHDNLVVIGASTGGLEVLRTILDTLPADFPAPVLIAMHVGALNSQLPSLLATTAALQIRHAVEGDSLEPGTVLIAPPDRHMLVEGSRIRLLRGAKENYSRPAIDPLFRSAAIAYREKVIGVVLTGDLDDGTVGLQAIKTCGGVALVQQPADATATSMPSSALRYVDVDGCLPRGQIASRLMELVGHRRPPATTASSPTHELENTISLASGLASMEALDQVATRSVLTCPECQGVLWEMDTFPLRYRCHTGHTYSPLSMRVSQDAAIEELLWAAVRAFHEKEQLMQRQSDAATSSGRTDQAQEYEMSAQEARARAHSLIQLMDEANTASPE